MKPLLLLCLLHQFHCPDVPMLRHVVALILSIAATILPVAAQGVIYPGEELVYEVSYLGINLGTIKTVTEPWTTYNGKKAAKVKVFIDSHPNIPFVSLHSVYESWMDENLTHSYQFVANTKVDDNTWEYDKYVFDLDGGVITTEKFRNKSKVESKTFKTKKKYNDGSSILFAARRLVDIKRGIKIPSLIMDDTVSTICNFQGERQTAEINASAYPVKCIYFNGEANWTGIYGLTGRFEGWFSDDEAKIPIKAKMKVYVGSVTLELKSWRRGNWQPPKAG
jgi:hypothetical protein